MRRSHRYWQDSANNVIQISYHYKKHFELISKLQSNKPKQSNKRYRSIKRMMREKANNKSVVRKLENEEITRENSRLLERIIGITDRKPESSY